MKIERWTLGLLSAGLVTLPAVAQAEEKPGEVLSNLAPTTLSGYVDTSAHWNLGTGNANLPYYTANGASGTTKADGFNLNVLSLTLSKPAGDGWSAGYSATLLFGPDAMAFNTSLLGNGGSFNNDFSLKDTYVDLRAPIGNGLGFKLGTFAGIIGYEIYETWSNPNYTRSYGYSFEPTQLTGVLSTYQLTSDVLLTGGICDAWNGGVGSRVFWPNNTASSPKAESFKTYLGSVAFTAPANWGVLAGSTLLGGVISGYDDLNGVDKTSLYAGGTIPTPLSNVKVGVSHDYLILGPNSISGVAASSGYQHASAVYLLWKATEKLTLNTRGEYFAQSGYLAGTGAGLGLPRQAFEVTQTVQYDLWKNVMARLEFRWDHAADSSDPFSNGVDNAFLVAANFIYRF